MEETRSDAGGGAAAAAAAVSDLGGSALRFGWGEADQKTYCGRLLRMPVTARPDLLFARFRI